MRKSPVFILTGLVVLLLLVITARSDKGPELFGSRTDDLIPTETLTPAALSTAKAPAGSPLSFCVCYPAGSSAGRGQTVNMRPGMSGTVASSTGQTCLKWYMDEDGYFTISFELPGTYDFRFTSVEEKNKNATFGGIIIGAGGGGGGALYSPLQSVGAGGGAGAVEIKEWSEFGKGWMIQDFMTTKTIEVGEGGDPGRQFRFCMCGGEKCPIGGPKEFPQAYGHNDGLLGGKTVFAEITAAGGAGGRGGACSGSRGCELTAANGSSSGNAGTYVFWGISCKCGYGGGGGSFGGDDGPGGDPTYFHDGDLSFGCSGAVCGGRGNGGGGSGYSYTYGHGMFTGTGTGAGRGSYSTVHFSTPAKGGNHPTYNGYIYLEGRIDVDRDENVAPVKERHQLIVTVYPTETDPIPVVEWSTTNAAVAMVGPTGIVSIKGDGEATITATAVQYGVQGHFRIRSGDADERFTIAPSRPLSKAGEKATMVASFPSSLQTESDPFSLSVPPSGNGTAIVPNESGQISVYWSSTNETVARIASRTGEIEILNPGEAVITATLADGSQASYDLQIK